MFHIEEATDSEVPPFPNLCAFNELSALSTAYADYKVTESELTDHILVVAY